MDSKVDAISKSLSAKINDVTKIDIFRFCYINVTNLTYKETYDKMTSERRYV